MVCNGYYKMYKLYNNNLNTTLQNYDMYQHLQKHCIRNRNCEF